MNVLRTTPHIAEAVLQSAAGGGAGAPPPAALTRPSSLLSGRAAGQRRPRGGQRRLRRLHRWLRPRCRECRAGRRQPSHRYPIRRATHVVEPRLVAEGDGLRLAPVLATDSDLEPRPRRAPLLGGDADQPPDSDRVEHLERVGLEDPALDVLRQEAPSIIA